jgi:esterase
LALDTPEAVERIVVVDIAPIAYPVAFRFYVQAMRGLDLGAVTRRREADAALTRSIPNTAERTFLLQSLIFTEGAPHWQLNLTALEATLPTISGFPDFPDGAHYDGSALFIGGGRSPALAPAYEPAVKALFPRAEIARIGDAGHWLHAEQPEAFLALVEPFLTA